MCKSVCKVDFFSIAFAFDLIIRVYDSVHWKSDYFFFIYGLVEPFTNTLTIPYTFNKMIFISIFSIKTWLENWTSIKYKFNTITLSPTFQSFFSLLFYRLYKMSLLYRSSSISQCDFLWWKAIKDYALKRKILLLYSSLNRHSTKFYLDV